MTDDPRKLVEEIRKRHWNDLGVCNECHNEHGQWIDWPCDAIDAADALTAALDRAEKAEAFIRLAYVRSREHEITVEADDQLPAPSFLVSVRGYRDDRR